MFQNENLRAEDMNILMGFVVFCFCCVLPSCFLGVLRFYFYPKTRAAPVLAHLCVLSLKTSLKFS